MTGEDCDPRLTFPPFFVIFCLFNLPLHPATSHLFTACLPSVSRQGTLVPPSLTFPWVLPKASLSSTSYSDIPFSDTPPTSPESPCQDDTVTFELQVLGLCLCRSYTFVTSGNVLGIHTLLRGRKVAGSHPESLSHPLARRLAVCEVLVGYPGVVISPSMPTFTATLSGEQQGGDGPRTSACP